jgi:hypothetical protein
MQPFKALKYRLEVGDETLNRPLPLHQRPFDEQAPSVSSGSVVRVRRTRKQTFGVTYLHPTAQELSRHSPNRFAITTSLGAEKVFLKRSRHSKMSLFGVKRG